MTYRSKIDWWIFLLVAGGGVMITLACINTILTRGVSDPASWVLLLSTVFYWAVIFALAFPVLYEITSSYLKIKSGLITTGIPLPSIVEAYPTRNPLSAPAWSLDRLHVSYQKKGKKTYALISPQEKEAFLRDLVRKAPHLEQRGSRVVQRGS